MAHLPFSDEKDKHKHKINLCLLKQPGSDERCYQVTERLLVSANFRSDVVYKTQHEPDLLALRSAVWGADHPHTNPRFLQWLFAATPPDDPIGAIVRLHGKVIGSAGLCRKRILVNGRNAQLAHGLDYMIMPDLKGLAVGYASVAVARRWIELARELDCAVGLVFPNENSYRIITSSHVGLRPVFQPALLLRPLPRIVLTQDIRRIPRRLGTAALRVAAIYGASRSALTGGEIALQVEDRFGPEYDDLWASMSDKVGIGVVRDSAYLNWRYVDHPVYRYERLCSRPQGKLQGLAVGSPRETFGVDSMLLVDLVAKEDSELLIRDLIEGFVRHAEHQGRGMVAALAIPGGKLYSALKRCGFIHVPPRVDPKPFRTASIVFTESANCAWNPSAWYFTWGDIDVV